MNKFNKNIKHSEVVLSFPTKFFTWKIDERMSNKKVELKKDLNQKSLLLEFLKLQFLNFRYLKHSHLLASGTRLHILVKWIGRQLNGNVKLKFQFSFDNYSKSCVPKGGFPSCFTSIFFFLCNFVKICNSIQAFCNDAAIEKLMFCLKLILNFPLSKFSFFWKYYCYFIFCLIRWNFCPIFFLNNWLND